MKGGETNPEPHCINRPQELHTLLVASQTEPRLFYIIFDGNIKFTFFRGKPFSSEKISMRALSLHLITTFS